MDRVPAKAKCCEMMGSQWNAGFCLQIPLNTPRRRAARTSIPHCAAGGPSWPAQQRVQGSCAAAGKLLRVLAAAFLASSSQPVHGNPNAEMVSECWHGSAAAGR